jgi:hypothetical protein
MRAQILDLKEVRNMKRVSILDATIGVLGTRGPAGRRKQLAGIVSTVAVLALFGVLLSSPAFAANTHNVTLSAGAGAPSASGVAKVQLDNTVLEGSARVEDLPSQAFGSGRFYGVWFVRTDTGDKAFLGALVQHSSIIFSGSGDGHIRFGATKFTTGPDAGSPISLGSAGTNLIIVLIENNINGLTPSPVGPVPGTGVAVSGTF